MNVRKVLLKAMEYNKINSASILSEMSGVDRGVILDALNGDSVSIYDVDMMLDCMGLALKAVIK